MAKGGRTASKYLNFGLLGEWPKRAEILKFKGKNRRPVTALVDINQR
jgi:hypothetical protein